MLCWRNENYSKYLSIHIIVWVNNFQTPKIQVVSSSFLREGNDVAHGSNRVGGWGGFNIVKNGVRRWLKARGPTWTFLVFIASKIKDNEYWRALRSLPSPLSINVREPWPANDTKAPLEAYTGSKYYPETSLLYDSIV